MHQSAGDFAFALLAPTRESSARLWIEHRRYCNQLAFSIANDPHTQRMACAGHFLHVDVFPGRIRAVADLDDAIAFVQAGFGSGAVGYDVADLGRRGGRDLGEADHEESGEHRHSQNDVHGWAGEYDNQTLPARLVQEAARVAGLLVARLLAHHLDVAAQQNEGKAKIGFALLESEQARAESEAERVHLHIEETRGPIVAEFVDQDHDADHDQRPPDIMQNVEAHKILGLY